MFLAGCTTQLATSREVSLPGGVRPGIPYRLPVLQYRITAKYRLTGCKPDDEGLLPFHADVSAESATIEGEARVIDYEGLSNHFKTSSFGVEFYDETAILKSINAAVTDKGPEIAASVLKTGVAIAKLAMGLPPGGGGKAAGIPPTALACKPGVDAVVKASEEAQRGVEALPKQAQEVADRIAVLTTKAQLHALTAADKRQAAADLKLSKTLADKLDKLRKQVADYNTRLSTSVEWRFTAIRDTTFQQLLVTPDQGDEWLASLIDGPLTRLTEQRIRLAMAASLAPTAPLPQCDPQHDRSKCVGASLDDGLTYRTPAPAVLKVCRSPIAARCAGDPAPLMTASASVPQFGSEHVLRLHNGWGEDNELTATFSKSGALTTFKYFSKSAPAEKAAAVAAEAAGQAVSLADAKRTAAAAADTAATADAAAKSKAETDAVQHQIDLLTLKQQLANLQATTASPTAELNAENADLAAQVSILQLQKQKSDLLAALQGSK